MIDTICESHERQVIDYDSKTVVLVKNELHALKVSRRKKKIPTYRIYIHLFRCLLVFERHTAAKFKRIGKNKSTVRHL